MQEVAVLVAVGRQDGIGHGVGSSRGYAAVEMVLGSCSAAESGSGQVADQAHATSKSARRRQG